MSRTDAGMVAGTTIAIPGLRRADFDAMVSGAGHPGAEKTVHGG